ncbi:Asp-tRNA(Asn)/Glu-tRNA(Gln) amidotransferase subunit GatC [Patescibacteria group bacterium]|nr:Asp-tRNA(Asn)/Glu-tRNA(Gln) amidotransferase subunit GatC [Patescibacteria group bacterium]MBU1967344.1 Asp-tRNA(Asn)/Glu-tRNA(Gln) amidotransferase subunit GatC [Patescibacteria group bacterium]
MKQKISKQLVKHIAQLANLEIDDSKIGLYQNQLSVILDHFNDLKLLSLANVPETSRIIEEQNIWREDIIESSFSQKEALENSKNTYQGFFVVPYVLINKDE